MNLIIDLMLLLIAIIGLISVIIVKLYFTSKEMDKETEELLKFIKENKQ